MTEEVLVSDRPGRRRGELIQEQVEELELEDGVFVNRTTTTTKV